MSLGYQGSIGVTFVAPSPPVVGTPPAGGCQQAAGQAVIGSDALVTVSLPFQPIGSVAPPVADAFVPFDGVIP